jgi:hypothetical protein
VGLLEGPHVSPVHLRCHYLKTATQTLARFDLTTIRSQADTIPLDHARRANIAMSLYEICCIETLSK